MMRTRNSATLLVGLLLFPLSCAAIDLPQAMLTLRVLGEDGLPITGANAGITFEQFGTDGRETHKSVKGTTDSNGLFSATASAFPYVHYGADKAGYYRSTNYEHEFKEEPQNGRWLPWNPTLTVVLKKIINPVPMYAKRARIEIPAVNETIGFDLYEADWVTPHGKGRVGDFAFYLTRRFTSRRDYEASLRLTFSEAGDGIQSVFADAQRGSQLRLPHNAPADGYDPRWERSDKNASRQERPDQNYFFRVRTHPANSKTHNAIYGKIHGEIDFDVINSRTAIIIFTYYLNPDGTRNVEFDPKRNLFKDLKPLEAPWQP